MKRFILITLTLCTLATSLVFSSGTVSAATRASLAPQHVAVALDQPTYAFYAGNWGWGICYSHSDTQSMDSNSGYGRYILNGWLSWRFGGAGFAASVVIEGYFWLMRVLDHGNGVCVAWAYGQWWLPVFWGR